MRGKAKITIGKDLVVVGFGCITSMFAGIWLQCGRANKSRWQRSNQLPAPDVRGFARDWKIERGHCRPHFSLVLSEKC